MSNFNHKITVNLGCSEYDKGKNIITKEIFEGNDKTQNAQLFIDNLEKTKQRHIEENNQIVQKTENQEEEAKVEETQPVIMDLNPKNFQKKDHIFMDFFSIYGKSFIQTKKGGIKSVNDMEKAKKDKIHTPFNQVYEQMQKIHEK